MSYNKYFYIIYCVFISNEFIFRFFRIHMNFFNFLTFLKISFSNKNEGYIRDTIRLNHAENTWV